MPGGVGGDVAEGVPGEAPGPWPAQREARGQLADGVGGLGAAAVAAQGDDEAARFEDVDVGAAVGGVGVGAAAGVPGADPDVGEQVGQGLAQGGQRPSPSPWSYQARTAPGSGSQRSVIVLAPNLR